MAQYALLVAVDCAPLGTIASTISREVQRNGGSDCYRAGPVRPSCLGSSGRPKLCKLACRPFLRRTVSTWRGGMVTAANCRLAQAHISGGISKAGVTRDDLSQPILQARGVLKRSFLST